MKLIVSHPLCDGSLVYPQPQAARGVVRSFFDSGPVMFAGNRRQEVLGRMADHLVEHEAYGSIDDARRLLHGLHVYASIDIAILVQEALGLARQFVETQDMVTGEIMDHAYPVNAHKR